MDDAARSSLINRHRETILGAIELGRGVSREWSGDRVTDSASITDPLERAVGESGLGQPLLELLVDAGRTVGSGIEGRPVSAPPYLAITSRGPVCRGTTPDGRRVVVTLALFAVERTPTAYTFLDPTPAECLAVSVKN
jgi:hypothetical protein